jgi:hypothetical protein
MTEGIQITEDIGEDETPQSETLVTASPLLNSTQQIDNGQNGVTKSSHLITMGDDGFGTF